MTVEELFRGIEENLGLKCPFGFFITNLLGNSKKMGPILMLINEDSRALEAIPVLPCMHPVNQEVLKPGDRMTETK